MAERKKLPAERKGTTFEIRIPRPGHRNGDLEMWVTINTFADTGRPGEIFIKSDRSGSMASGALDAVAMSLSIAWQYGVPFEKSIGKFVNMRFEPEGMTGDPEFPIVTSPLDYIARLALARFGRKDEDELPSMVPPAVVIEDELCPSCWHPKHEIRKCMYRGGQYCHCDDKCTDTILDSRCDGCPHVRTQHHVGEPHECGVAGCSCTKFSSPPTLSLPLLTVCAGDACDCCTHTQREHFSGINTSTCCIKGCPCTRFSRVP